MLFDNLYKDNSKCHHGNHGDDESLHTTRTNILSAKYFSKFELSVVWKFLANKCDITIDLIVLEFKIQFYSLLCS